MQKCFIESQPAVVRKLIDQAIEAEGFQNYDALAERFKRFGKGFSKSAIHRYAKRLEEMKRRAQFEAEVMGNLGDDAAFLLTWARTHPKDAARFVVRLKERLKKPLVSDS